VRLGLRAVVVSTFVVAVTLTTVAISLLAHAVTRSQADGFRETSERGNYQHTIDLALVNAQVKGQIAEQARAHPETATPEGLTTFVQRTLGFTFAAVLDPQHPSASCATRPCWSDLPPQVQAAAVEGQTFIGGAPPTERPSTYWLAVTPLDASVGDGHLVLAASALGLDSEPSYRALWSRTALVVAAGLVLAVVGGLAVAASIRRPLRRITAATERFGQGDVTARAPAGGSDELRRLGATFNRMADQLHTTLDELHGSREVQRRFVADVAHELRTPLATMLATLEGLDTPATRERAAVLLAAQTRRLAGLVEDLLEISRFDAGQVELRPEPVDLGALIRDAARSVGVEVVVEGSALHVVDPGRMHTVVRNLLVNAVRHGVPPVHVEVVERAGGVALTVEDQGPGIPAEQQAVLFARFGQGSSARDGGTGLGLAIAHENVRLHSGTLEVSTTAPTRFTVWLPTSDP
jgi:signal transduction histidine kinase